LEATDETMRICVTQNLNILLRSSTIKLCAPLCIHHNSYGYDCRHTVEER
jgi:hypothetical protein